MYGGITYSPPEGPVDLSRVPNGTLGDESVSNIIISMSIISFSHYRQLSPTSVSDSIEESTSVAPTWNLSWFE